MKRCLTSTVIKEMINQHHNEIPLEWLKSKRETIHKHILLARIQRNLEASYIADGI